MENEMKYVNKKLQELDTYVKENMDVPFWEVYEVLQGKLNALQTYAKEKGVPLKVTVDEIIYKHREESYEEEYSSYYEEEDSYYEEEPEEDTE